MPGQGMQTRLLPGQSLALQQVLSPQLQQSLLVLQTPLLELRNLLQQNLLGQLNQTALNASDRKAAELIVGNIDDKGFLQSAPEEMALNSGIPQEDFEKMLALIQGFHPPGVGARDLRECLLIQLRREGKENSLEYKIVSEHMEDLGRRRFPEIARRMGISVEDVQKAADNIGRLNPRAGQVFAAAPQNYVLPDVTVEKVDGEYQITLNDEQIPHLRISNLYKDIIASGNTQSGEVKDYIRDKIRSGKFLIRSIHQRQQTISNIAKQIVSRQRDFLEHGRSHLKPMTMADVADVVGVHETTVSRAVSGKYMATPQGIFEMKYFFTPGYQTAGGESLSNTSVKEAILDLVKREDGNQPLSDNEIVEILSERGIPIARRTVAKYRSELNILPSHMRRKY